MSNLDDALDDPRHTAVQKAVRLMQALAEAESPQSLADIADRVAMPKPSVHRLISQLEDVGMLQRDPSGKGYHVGSTWLRLSFGALEARARQPPIRTVMRALVEHVGESCNFAILQDDEVLYLERVECDWPLRMQLKAGSRVPIHCTASGKLLLALLPKRNRTSLLKHLPMRRYTENTIVDPARMEAEAQAIRRSGISVNREEYHVGLIGVAVPVVRTDGTAIAALAIHAPIFRMNVDVALNHVPTLSAAAGRIAELMCVTEDSAGGLPADGL